MRNSGARIIHRGLTRPAQNLLSQIGLGLQITLFGQHHEHGFTWIDEHPAPDPDREAIQPGRAGYKPRSPAAGAGLLAQALGCSMPCRLVVDVIGWGVGHEPKPAFQ